MQTGTLGPTGAATLLAAVAGESPAHLVRVGLEHQLRAGLDFDEAWAGVMKAVGRSHGNWGEVWRSSRPSWEAAYRRRQAAAERTPVAA